MRRIACLYNGVAFEQLQAICCDAPIDLRLNDNGVIEIYARFLSKANSDIFDTNIGDYTKRLFVSLNKCVLAIGLSCRWLAYCTEGAHFLRT